MSSLRKILLYQFCLFFGLFCPSLCLNDFNFICEKITACQCIFPVGQGIDLTKLKEPWLLGSSNNSSLLFNPCSNIPILGDNECSNGAALCLFDNVTKQYTLLGKVDESTFVSQSLTDPVYLKYVHKNITTEILLKCDPSAVASVLTQDPDSTKFHYKLTLQSVYACHTSMDPARILGDPTVDHGLSTGSVLVIIFFTFSALYLFGGAVLLKLLRGAEGKELVPNYDFWSGLPGLVRDGAMFAFSCGQAAATYDRI